MVSGLDAGTVPVVYFTANWEMKYDAIDFYVGDELSSEDIHAKYEGGVLTLKVPKKQEQQELEHPERIMIEG